MPATCPSDNTLAVEQERFWDGNWDAHKIGWLISGAAAAVTLFIALITIFGHSLNYHRPAQQRQIIRILFFPPVFAIVSFFSYRFFRSYNYYELVEVIYEAIAIAAFLILMLAYIGDDDVSQMRLFATKDKRKMPMPFCCWRYRPSKAYFLILTKWSVVQYCFVRPALSIAGIVLEYYGLLCNDSLSYQYGHVYLLAIDFVSISVALYGLIVLYGLIKDDLQGKRPLSKFVSIKLGIMFIFYQSFVFSILQDHGVIKGTQYWTATNVSDGLNALATTLEMVIIALFQMWAFPWSEYKEYHDDAGNSEKKHKKRRRAYTNPVWPILHAIWMGDLAVEGWHSIRFAFDRIRGKEYTRQDARFNAVDFVGAFEANAERNEGHGRPIRTQTNSSIELNQRGIDNHQASRSNTMLASNYSPKQNMPTQLAPWNDALGTLRTDDPNGSGYFKPPQRLQPASAKADYSSDSAMQMAMFGPPAGLRGPIGGMNGEKGSPMMQSRAAQPPTQTAPPVAAPPVRASMQTQSESVYSNPSVAGTADGTTYTLAARTATATPGEVSASRQTTPTPGMYGQGVGAGAVDPQAFRAELPLINTPGGHVGPDDASYYYADEDHREQERPLSWEPQAM